MCENRVTRRWVAICLALALGAAPLAIGVNHETAAPAKQVVNADSGWPAHSPNE
jgi:hypothetical protein